MIVTIALHIFSLISCTRPFWGGTYKCLPLMKCPYLFGSEESIIFVGVIGIEHTSIIFSE